MAKSKLVKCDSCGLTIDVPQRGDEAFRLFRCPNCSHKLRADFDPQPEDSSGTIYGGGRATNRQQKRPDSEGTVYAAKKNVRTCMLKCGGKTYSLHNGRNIIGRKASVSDTDVQIETADKHMSRQHATIKVTRVADGSMRTLISCNKDRLTTIVNGQSLAVGDEVVLTSGVSVVLGQTSLLYVEE